MPSFTNSTGFLLLACVSLCTAQNTEGEVRTAIFCNYNPGVRPVHDASKPISITVDITLHQIVDLNEKLQYLQSQLWFRMFWKDEFLRWNKTQYKDLHHIQVDESEVWTPDIEIYNEMGLETRNDRYNFPVTVEHNGDVNWRFPRTLQTGCKVNITNFPHDSQKCDLDIGSWTLDSRFANVTAHKDHGDVSAFKTSGEWTLVAIPSRSVHVPYEALDYGFSVVVFTIILQRSTNYYIVHMIFPCILISFVNACAFLLPVSSGERMSMSVTTLLGLVVFLLIIADLMPPTSGVVPIIDVYFGMCITVVSLSVLLNVFIIHLHFRGSRGSRMPRWLRAVIYRLGIVLMYRKLMNDVGFSSNDVNTTNDDVVQNGGNEVKLTNIRKIGVDETNDKRRATEIFSCEDDYLSITKQERLDPITVHSGYRRRSRSSSSYALDPITETCQRENVNKHGSRENPPIRPHINDINIDNSISTEWKITAIILDRFFFCFVMILLAVMMGYVLTTRSHPT